MPRWSEMNVRLRLFVLLLLVATPLLALMPDPYLLKLATRTVIFALAASALDLALGVGGLVSFGHAAFFGLGAYVVGINFLHAFEGSRLLGLPPTSDIYLQLLLAAALGAFFALLSGAVSLRTRGIAFIMITLAFAQMLFYLSVSLRRYNGADGIALWNRSDGRFLDLESEPTFYLFALFWLLAFLLFGWRLQHSRFGRALRAARDNERRARALGFDVHRIRLTAYVLSGTVCALAGALFANFTYFVGPSYLSWPISGQLVVMVVMGGLGTLFGPVLGALAFVGLEELLPDLLDRLLPGFGEHWKIVLGPVLLLLALFARRGLLGAIEGRRRTTGRRPAKPFLEAAAGD